jgi:prophage regulatory protein
MHQINTTTDTTGKRQRTPQPLDVANNPDALLDGDTVDALTGFKRSKRYDLEAKGLFPRGIRLGTRCTRWRAGDVTEWLKAQKPSEPVAPKVKARVRGGGKVSQVDTQGSEAT